MNDKLPLPAGLRRVHMIGIGGAGMSGVARLLLARGGAVSGSDVKESRGVVALRARGAVISVPHTAEALDALPEQPEAVVVSLAAIPRDNPELVEAQRRGIPVVTRSQVLARLMDGYRTVLVAGTHGKTSTTSLATVALQHAGLDPSFAVGGELNESGTNAFAGSSDLFVAEADESDGSLLQYRGTVAVVTTVEPDHLDHFHTEQAYRQVFVDFLDRIEDGGALVACLDDPGARALAVTALERGVRVRGYVSADALDEAREAVGEDNIAAVLETWRPRASGLDGSVRLAGEEQTRALRISLPGKHMGLNATAALVVAVECGADPARALSGLEAFGGVRRRFQYHGESHGVRVYDDYAHHPTEVRAVLTAAEGLKHTGEARRVLVAFQPHLYSRTREFATEFGAALALADTAIVLDVYGAREQPIDGVSGALIADAIVDAAPQDGAGAAKDTAIPTGGGTAAGRTEVYYEPIFARVPDLVARLSQPGDVVLTMGAGDVTMLADEILRRIDHLVDGEQR